MTGDIIILEGPDGAGKTTAVDQLIDIIDTAEHPAKFNIIHNDVPPEGMRSGPLFRLYMLQLTAAVHLRKTNGVTTIIDRSWPSELIYGPRYRGGSLITPWQSWRLQTYARTHGLVLLSVEAELHTRIDRLLERGEKIDVWIGAIGRDYAKYFQSHEDWIPVNRLLTDHNK